MSLPTTVYSTRREDVCRLYRTQWFRYFQTETFLTGAQNIGIRVRIRVCTRRWKQLRKQYYRCITYIFSPFATLCSERYDLKTCEKSILNRDSSPNTTYNNKIIARRLIRKRVPWKVGRDRSVDLVSRDPSATARVPSLCTCGSMPSVFLGKRCFRPSS